MLFVRGTRDEFSTQPHFDTMLARMRSGGRSDQVQVRMRCVLAGRWLHWWCLSMLHVRACLPLGLHAQQVSRTPSKACLTVRCVWRCRLCGVLERNGGT